MRVGGSVAKEISKMSVSEEVRERGPANIVGVYNFVRLFEVLRRVGSFHIVPCKAYGANATD